MPYADVYGLEPLESIRTIFRGTLRYPGFADLMYALKSIGLLEGSTTIDPHDWHSLVRAALEQKLGTLIMNDPDSLKSALDDVISPKQRDVVLEALHWLSIIPPSMSERALDNDSNPSLPPLPSKPTAPIDLFATLLTHKLRYAPHERDLVVLSHEIVTRPKGSQVSLTTPSAGEEEIHSSSLVTYGTKDASAMSRTVGLPVAFAALQILDGGVSARGVQGPTSKEVYGNVLRRLEEVGLGMKESVRKATAGSALGLSVEENLRRRWRVMQEMV